MEPIVRGKGGTASERILADLGNQAFLSLWSYPNLYYDKKQNNKGDGKELCDLLVVCGDDVIIFSDKHIAWQADRPIEVAWPRFYKRAVQESIDQILGAARWLDQHPDRIFMDAACTRPLPIGLPAKDKRRVHGVVVAGGAYTACQRHNKDDSGSFIVVPHFKGEKQHTDFSADGFVPFAVGDPNPDGMFMHIFDDRTIKTVLNHLDTITDFVFYLTKREQYIRSGALLMAHGEEELLARYLYTGMMFGIRGFEGPRKKKFKKHLAMTAQGEWRTYLFSSEYFAKTQADRVSYLWDDLIGLFTTNVLEGTSVSILGHPPSAEHSEKGLRFMALEDRFTRRILGESVRSAYQTTLQGKYARFARVMMPSTSSRDQTVAYVLLILAYPKDLEDAGGLTEGYEQYRQARVQILEGYCLALLSDHRELKTAVGIAVDASFAQTGRRGGSEDLMAIQVDEWTDELTKEIAEAREKFDILKSERLITSSLSADDYPTKNPRPRKHK